MAVISEDHIEQVVIQEFVELGYHYLNGADISPDGHSPEREYREVILKSRLQNAIALINPTVFRQMHRKRPYEKYSVPIVQTYFKTTINFINTSPMELILSTVKEIELQVIKFG
ncbi:MAG: hypothetical protein BGP01_12280 [Paludibacter sp. 47-17]|mgnify:CR=1 FL=1|nr:MAG: hypothetical protein BGP01_12280 [Paludibacter sp. 47-17]